jgi:hypothetical protein
MSLATLRRALFIGLLGGIAVWHLSLVGLIPAFAQRRLIGETLTFSYALLVALFALAAHATGRRYPGALQRVAWGTLSALTAGLLVLALAFVVTQVNLRQIFLNATPDLARVLTFGAGVSPAGILRTLLIAAVAGIISGVVGAAPAPWGRVSVSAALATLLLGLLRDVLGPILPSGLVSFLYGPAGLSVPGAVVIFVLFFLLFALRWSLSGRAGAERPVAFVPSPARGPLARLVVILLLASVPLWAGLFLSNVADFVGFYILMGLGLNLVLGFAGLLDLGYVAFFAVGAYTMAVLTSPEIGQRFTLDFWVALRSRSFSRSVLASWSVYRSCGCAVITWRSPHSDSARSSACSSFPIGSSPIWVVRRESPASRGHKSVLSASTAPRSSTSSSFSLVSSPGSSPFACATRASAAPGSRSAKTSSSLKRWGSIASPPNSRHSRSVPLSVD